MKGCDVMTSTLKELNALYCELTWKMNDVTIKMKENGSTFLSKRAYINILEPGTVVSFNGQRYFYSCPLGEMNLEGGWTNEESVFYSAHEFLCNVIDADCPVEVVLEG